MTPAIRVTNVSKKFRLYHERPTSLKERFVRASRSRYDELWALRDVSLEVDRGSSFGLIGHNGSGKSTLLKLMAGIYRPTSGEIRADGRIASLLELGAGFHPELTGRENIFLNGSIMGLSTKDIERSFDSIVEFSGLGDFIDNPVKLYSSGMYVRLGFAVAVNLDPEILLVDEVIAVGDEEFQRKCMDHIHQLRRGGCTIVFVSHSLASVETICDSAVWLDHGHIKAAGNPAQVCDAYLDHVNEQERTRLGSGSRDHLPAKQGRVVITDMQFLDEAGDETLTVTTGRPLTMRLHFEASDEVDAATFFFGFHQENGAHVAEPSSRGTALEGVALKGRGYVDYSVDEFPLLPGTYLVSASIWDRDVTHPFDYRDKARVLHVQPPSGPRHNGIVELPGRWTAEQL